MSEDDLERARKAGEQLGKMLTKIDNLTGRLNRLEKGVVAIVGMILAAWAKSKGLF